MDPSSYMPILCQDFRLWTLFLLIPIELGKEVLEQAWEPFEIRRQLKCQRKTSCVSDAKVVRQNYVMNWAMDLERKTNLKNPVTRSTKFQIVYAIFLWNINESAAAWTASGMSWRVRLLCKKSSGMKQKNFLKLESFYLCFF